MPGVSSPKESPRGSTRASGGHRGVSRERRARESARGQRTRRPARPLAGPCGTFRSRSRRGEISRSSARTAPGRRRCYVRSRAPTASAAARSCTTATISRTFARTGASPRDRARSRRPAPVLRNDGCGESPRSPEPRAVRGVGTSRRCYDAFPMCARALARSVRRRSLGGPTAGDRDRPRADDQSARLCSSTRCRSGSRPSP